MKHEYDEHIRGSIEPVDREQALRMQELRIAIADVWRKTTELMKKLQIRQRPHFNEKIIECRARSDDIRQEIRRLIAVRFPENKKAGELILLLTAAEETALAIQSERNEFHARHRGLVGSFMERNPTFYAKVFDFSTRANLAECGLIRAADTYSPAVGTFSTFAEVCMKSVIRNTARKEKVEKTLSLDTPIANREGETSPRQEEDKRAVQPEDIARRHELHGALHSVLLTMPVQWKRALELIKGIGGEKACSAEQAAITMNEEGLLTISRKKRITADKVSQWVKQAERMIARDMASFMKQLHALDDE